jgi:hypothetical protein
MFFGHNEIIAESFLNNNIHETIFSCQIIIQNLMLFNDDNQYFSLNFNKSNMPSNINFWPSI